MRLLQLVHQYLPDFIGGTELYTQSLVQTLAARGYEVTVFYRRSAPGAGLAQRDEAGVTVCAAWDGELTAGRRFGATFYAPGLVASFRRVLDQTSPELVHIQHLMGLPVSLVTELRARKIPYVITLHDFWWVCANAQLLTNYSHEICAGPRAYLNCARCALARAGAPHIWPALPPLAGLLAARARRLRGVLQQAARLVAPSEFVGHWYTEYGVPPERLRVIPHGIASPARDTSPDRAPGVLRCVYLGGLAWQKGVHVIVEALREVRDAELWIAGDERFDPAYSAQLRALAGDNTHFLGRLSRDEVWRILAQADLLLVPSLWYETFSLVVREAFSMGAPVLVSNIGALAEAVHEGVDGLSLPPGDVAAWRQTVASLVQDRERYARLRAGVRAPLTLAVHVSEIEALYAEIV